MYRSMAWKEYREHRWGWVLMAGSGLLVTMGLPALQNSIGGRPLEPAFFLAFSLSIVCLYGIMCGAMLFAGERETGTTTFLDMLGADRLHVWTAKTLTGLALSVANAILLATSVIVARPLVESVTTVEWGLAVPIRIVDFEITYANCYPLLVLASLVGFSWAVLFSVLCRRVIVAGFLALQVGVVAVVLASIADQALLPVLADGHWQWLVLLLNHLWLYFLLMTPLALVGSAHAYRQRDSAFHLSLPVIVGFKQSLWLCIQQARTCVLVLAIGLPWLVVLLYFLQFGIWPLGTLFIGVTCGIATCAADRSQDSYRFLGDRRLPVGTLWAVKTGVWLFVAIALSAIFLAPPVFLVIDAEPYDSGRRAAIHALVDRQFYANMRLMNFATVWLAHGFAFGQFFALFMRKLFVAIFMAVMVSGTLLFVWVPSLLMGGVSAWQLLVLPLAVLIVGRLAYRSWASGCLTPMRVGGLVISVMLVSTVWMAGNLWWRVAAVPDVGEPFDVAAFKASKPFPGQDQASLLTGKAVSEFEYAVYLLASERWFEEIARHTGSGPLGRRNVQSLAPSLQVLLVDADPILWQTNGPLLSQGLDTLFVDGWDLKLKKAARLPTGTIKVPKRQLADVRYMANALSWRALQRQSENDWAEALDKIDALLGLARNSQNFAAAELYSEGLETESIALKALDRWLMQVGPQRRVLEQCLDRLNYHQKQVPSFANHLQTTYLVVRDFEEIHPLRQPGVQFGDIAGALSIFPFEEERLRRLTNGQFASMLHAAESSYPLVIKNVLDGGDYYFPVDFTDRAGNRISARALAKLFFDQGITSKFALLGLRELANNVRTRSNLEAHRLITALALFHAMNGRPASKLEELVPAILEELPQDPLSGQSFRYGLPAGDELNWRSGLKAGQRIVWSVGPHGRNELANERPPDVSTKYQIYVVPTWDGNK